MQPLARFGLPYFLATWARIGVVKSTSSAIIKVEHDAKGGENNATQNCSDHTAAISVSTAIARCAVRAPDPKFA